MSDTQRDETEPRSMSQTVEKEHGEKDNDDTASTPSTSHDDAVSNSEKQGEVEKQEPAPKPTERSKGRIAIVMFALALAVFLSALDTTIVTTALPTITAHFQSETVYIWVGSTYLLAVAATTVAWGKLSDIFGRKPVLLLANVVFFVGALIAALAVNVPMLLVARCIQGAGGGGLNVLVNISIGDLFSPRRRGAFYGITGAVWAVALSVGPVIGGALAQGVSWRWCFYINLPFDGLAFFIILFFVDLKTPKTALWEGLAAIDWLGALLSIGGTLMILLGLSFGGVSFPWDSATVICLIIFGVVVWVLCMVWEAYGAKLPILPTRILKQRNAMILLGVCFCQSIVYVAAPYYLPLYFQGVLGSSPTLSGVYLIPIAVTLSIASIATGMFMSRTGNYRIPIIIGFVLQTLGFGLFIDLGPTANWAKIIIFQGIAGLGVGPNFQAPMIALQSYVSPGDIATATSAFQLTRNVAASVSIVIGQVVYQNEMQKQYSKLAAALGPSLAQELAGGAAGAETAILRTLPHSQQVVAHDALTHSFMYLWIMYTAFSGAGLVICLLVGKKPLSSEHQEAQTGLEAERKRKEDALKYDQEQKEREAAEKK